MGADANFMAIEDAQIARAAVASGLTTNGQKALSLLEGSGIVALSAVAAAEAAPAELASTAGVSAFRSALLAVRTAGPVAVSAVAAGATKVASVVSDLYEKAGKLVTAAENAEGLPGKVFNLGMGVIKGYLNGRANVQPGADLKATGLIAANRAAQQAGIQVERIFQAVMKVAGLW